MSESVSLPLNLALTGPTRATISTWNSFSPVRSIDSQPGTQVFSISGSLSASQTTFCGAAISCSPVISMLVLPLRCPEGVAEGSRQVDEALQIMHGKEQVDVRQHRAHAGGSRL